MSSEIARWLGAVALGLAYGGLVWLAHHWMPWRWDLPLWPALSFGLAVALFLAWIGLPLLPGQRWDPQTPRAQAYEKFRLRAVALGRARRDTRVDEALGFAGLGLALLLMGFLASIFLIGGFSSSSGAGVRSLCFGGALACGAGAWWRGGRLGRVLAAFLAVVTIVAWSLFL